MKNVEKLIRKIIDMLAFKLNLRLLSIEENKKYVIKNLNYHYDIYYIFKKCIKMKKLFLLFHLSSAEIIIIDKITTIFFH